MTGTTPGRRCVSSPRRKGKQTLLSEEARRLAERFRQHQLKQGYTERVVQEQIRQVETFQRYLALKRLTPDGMTPERLKEYMGFVSFLTEILHGRQLTQSTLFGWRVTLRHYYRWLMGEGLVSKDPARRVGSKAWRWIPKWVPESGLVEKLLTLPDEYSYTGMRDQVIFGLAATVGLTTAELSYLPDRRMAFENLAKRCGHAGVKAVATALNQAERYGTPMGQALRVASQENREMRMSEAEKRAASLPAKLTVPMIVFFLPCLFVVILGPAIMKIMHLTHH